MRILALEPYYGGSHQAFLDGWIARSQHDWDLITLPAYKWKWRMRHAPITMAAEVTDRLKTAGGTWDVLFSSEMLNLAEFIGLVPPPLSALPRVVLFHENQLTYPSQHADARDLHFAFSNITTALAADEVWFNSDFHRQEFLSAALDLARRMPDHQPTSAIERIRAKSAVRQLGIETIPAPAIKRDRCLDILWAARWEHDKDPETFFAAMSRLRQCGCQFRLHVIGQSFREVPAIFAEARRDFDRHIARWGYQDSHAAYVRVLQQADVIVSTARHEFLGLSVLEAMSAGTVPLLPNRLAYPELLGDSELAFACLYDGTADALAERLQQWCDLRATDRWSEMVAFARHVASGFDWQHVAMALDEQLNQCHRA
jgi:glycosyltransferase involved in cell wall biosynthesis